MSALKFDQPLPSRCEELGCPMPGHIVIWEALELLAHADHDDDLAGCLMELLRDVIAVEHHQDRSREDRPPTRLRVARVALPGRAARKEVMWTRAAEALFDRAGRWAACAEGLDDQDRHDAADRASALADVFGQLVRWLPDPNQGFPGPEVAAALVPGRRLA